MAAAKAGTVRIIAGEWRGRRLPVADVAGLRPSGDRCRETLFSWIQNQLRGADCIDLFAGTGVLGLEALSRGAASAALVELSPIAVAALRKNVAMLDAGNENGSRANVVQADALQWLSGRAEHSADLVFIDPPFGQGLALTALEAVSGNRILRPGGLVYLETARTEPVAVPVSQWELLREKQLGEVQMRLLRKIG